MPLVTLDEREFLMFQIYVMRDVSCQYIIGRNGIVVRSIEIRSMARLFLSRGTISKDDRTISEEARERSQKEGGEGREYVETVQSVPVHGYLRPVQFRDANFLRRSRFIFIPNQEGIAFPIGNNGDH